MKLQEKATALLTAAALLGLIFCAGCSNSAQDNAASTPAPKLVGVTAQGQTQQQAQEQSEASLRAAHQTH